MKQVCLIMLLVGLPVRLQAANSDDWGFYSAVISVFALFVSTLPHMLANHDLDQVISGRPDCDSHDDPSLSSACHQVALTYRLTLGSILTFWLGLPLVALGSCLSEGDKPRDLFTSLLTLVVMVSYGTGVAADILTFKNWEALSNYIGGDYRVEGYDKQFLRDQIWGSMVAHSVMAAVPIILMPMMGLLWFRHARANRVVAWNAPRVITVQIDGPVSPVSPVLGYVIEMVQPFPGVPIEP